MVFSGIIYVFGFFWSSFKSWHRCSGLDELLSPSKRIYRLPLNITLLTVWFVVVIISILYISLIENWEKAASAARARVDVTGWLVLCVSKFICYNKGWELRAHILKVLKTTCTGLWVIFSLLPSFATAAAHWNVCTRAYFSILDVGEILIRENSCLLKLSEVEINDYAGLINDAFCF